LYSAIEETCHRSKPKAFADGAGKLRASLRVDSMEPVPVEVVVMGGVYGHFAGRRRGLEENAEAAEEAEGAEKRTGKRPDASASPVPFHFPILRVLRSLRCFAFSSLHLMVLGFISSVKKNASH
jgi:hypothetical protein